MQSLMRGHSSPVRMSAYQLRAQPPALSHYYYPVSRIPTYLRGMRNRTKQLPGLTGPQASSPPKVLTAAPPTPQRRLHLTSHQAQAAEGSPWPPTRRPAQRPKAGGGAGELNVTTERRESEDESTRRGLWKVRAEPGGLAAGWWAKCMTRVMAGPCGRGPSDARNVRVVRSVQTVRVAASPRPARSSVLAEGL